MYTFVYAFAYAVVYARVYANAYSRVTSISISISINIIFLDKEENILKRKEWKESITEACQTAGTYQPNFEAIVDTLSDILEQRDSIYEQYVKEGAEAVVVHKSDRGAENRKINPLLTAWDNLNKTALTYWKELGGTPAGLKKLNIEAKAEIGFEQLLTKLT